MDKKIEDFQVENMLENWQKKPLDDKALLAAQNRVWSKIQSKTSNSNLIANNSSNLSMSDNQNVSQNIAPKKEVISPKPWFMQPLGISVLSISLLIVLVGGVTTFYVLKSPNQPSVQIADNKIQNNLNGGNGNNQYAKLDLSLDEIRSRATLKLNTLTNGVSLEVIEASSAKSPKMASQMTVGIGSGGGETSLINTPTPENLVKEKGIADNVVYYSENITTESNGGYMYTYMSGNPNFDLKKPVKSQSWSSANYSKYILSQDGKIISYNIYSPEFSVDYRGGKYAIKEFFDQKIYLSGISQDASNANTEINFLRSILSDTTLKDSGIQNINGKDYKVLETDPGKQIYGDGSTGDTYTIKYFIDQEKLSVFKTENYKNNILVSTTTQSNYQELKEPKLDDIFGVSDLGNIEIKTTQGISYNDESQTLPKIVSKADIFYPSSLDEKTLQNNFYATDSSVYTDSESSKLRNSLDFDPSLDRTYLETLLNPPVVNYSFDNISVNVFKTKPNDEQFLLVQNESKKTIKIDGRDVEAVFKTVTYEYGPSQGGGVQSSVQAPAPESFYRLEFTTPNGLFYQFVEYKPLDGSNKLYIQSSNISLVKLSSSLASQINDYQQKRQQSYPDLNYETNLEDISKNIRILPGDLSRDYKIEPTTVSKSRRLGSLSTCDQFLFSGFDLQGCLIEKHNGFTINYYEKNTQPATYIDPAVSTSPAQTVNDLTFSVLDAEIDSIDLKKYSDAINQNNSQNKVSLNPFNDVVANTIELVYNDGYSATTLYFIASGDKTIIASSMTLNRDQILKIANGSSPDKDLAILSSQLKQRLLPQPVDLLPRPMNK